MKVVFIDKSEPSNLKINCLYDVLIQTTTFDGNSYYHLSDSEGNTYYWQNQLRFKPLSEIRRNKLRKIC